MKENFQEETVFDFLGFFINRHLKQVLPGGKRWLRLHEVEKLIDIPREEIILLAEQGEIMVSYIGDHEIFDYMEICEMMEGQKRFKAPPELREKFG